MSSFWGIVLYKEYNLTRFNHQKNINQVLQGGATQALKLNRMAPCDRQTVIEELVALRWGLCGEARKTRASCTSVGDMLNDMFDKLEARGVLHADITGWLERAQNPKF